MVQLPTSSNQSTPDRMHQPVNAVPLSNVELPLADPTDSSSSAHGVINTPSAPHIFLSQSGGVYTSTMFPFSANPDIQQAQEDDITSLEKVFAF